MSFTCCWLCVELNLVFVFSWLRRACCRRALGMRPGWRRAPPKLEPVEELRRQANIAVRVLTIFRGAALLLDEVCG